jgi:hypothetical protein
MSKHKDLRILENTGEGGLSLKVHKVYRGWSATPRFKPEWSFLCTLPTDPPGQLDVLGHDGDPLGVDGAQVGVLEQPNQVGLAGLLQGTNGGGLEPQVSLEVLSNLPDQPLEGQLADQQLGRLLVTPDLTESDCAGPVPMGLLHSSGGWCRLSGCLGRQLLPWGFASCGLTGGLLRTSHISAVSAKG